MLWLKHNGSYAAGDIFHFILSIFVMVYFILIPLIFSSCFKYRKGSVGSGMSPSPEPKVNRFIGEKRAPGSKYLLVNNFAVDVTLPRTRV